MLAFSYCTRSGVALPNTGPFITGRPHAHSWAVTTHSVFHRPTGREGERRFYLKRETLLKTRPQSKSVSTEARAHTDPNSIDPRHRVGRTCNQGRGERPGARDRQHSGPPLPPRPECGSAQPERRVSRPGLGHFLNETEGLCAPPASRLESDNHETTPLCCDEFGISGFLVTSSLGQDGSIYSGSIWARSTAASQRASEG